MNHPGQPGHKRSPVLNREAKQTGFVLHRVTWLKSLGGIPLTKFSLSTTPHPWVFSSHLNRSNIHGHLAQHSDQCHMKLMTLSW